MENGITLRLPDNYGANVKALYDKNIENKEMAEFFAREVERQGINEKYFERLKYYRNRALSKSITLSKNRRKPKNPKMTLDIKLLDFWNLEAINFAREPKYAK